MTRRPERVTTGTGESGATRGRAGGGSNTTAGSTETGTEAISGETKGTGTIGARRGGTGTKGEDSKGGGGTEEGRVISPEEDNEGGTRRSGEGEASVGREGGTAGPWTGS